MLLDAIGSVVDWLQWTRGTGRHRAQHLIGQLFLPLLWERSIGSCKLGQ